MANGRGWGAIHAIQDFDPAGDYVRGRSYAERMMMLDYQKQLDARAQEMKEAEEVRAQTEHDLKTKEWKRKFDLEKQKADLAMGIRETESRIEQIGTTIEKPKGISVKDRAGKKLPHTSKKKALEILKIKKIQAQRELRTLADPLSGLPEKIGAKKLADIKYTEAGTVLRKAQTEAANARARLDNKKATESEKEEDRKTIWKFARDWLKMSMSPEEKESLSPEQYNQWLGSLVQQYIDGVRPENFQLPQITEKEPTKKSFLGMDFLARDETRADTSFYPFDESEMEKRYLR